MTIVETGNGKLEGVVENGVTVFRGIPYAAPPVGRRRWLPPHPVANWDGIRPAKEFGASALQNGSPLDQLLGGNVGPISEDCLYLNVWTQAADKQRRPVMVWIHGGAFVIGSGSQPVYHGDRLAKRGDVVVVTVNYRLGALGFLNLKEATKNKIPSTGTEGLQDIIAALRWVRDNISAFGGDPNNVTLFGESAGGMAIGCLLSLKQADRLFHKAILQSGASHTTASKADAMKVTEAVFAATGLKPNDPDAMLKADANVFRKAQADLALNKVEGIRAAALGGLPFRPVVDGEFMIEQPIGAIRRGAGRDVAILTGTTTEEWNFFSAMDPSLANLDKDSLLKRLDQVLPGVKLDGLLTAHTKQLAAQGKKPSFLNLLSAIQTDRIFTEPAYRLLNAHMENGGTAYNYLFDWKSPMGAFGSCHALDIGFVLGTYNMPGAEGFFGSGKDADTLANMMMDAWICFAKTGKPTVRVWQPYTAEKRETWLFGMENRMITEPSQAVRDAWVQVPDTVIGRA